MKQRIDDHQVVQDLRGQVEEIMDYCIRSGYTVERFRNTIICLLSEHQEGSTDEFRKHKTKEEPPRIEFNNLKNARIASIVESLAQEHQRQMMLLFI